MRPWLLQCLVTLVVVLGSEQKLANLQEERAMACTEEKCDAPLEDAYMTFEQMQWYLQKLEARYPAVEVSSIGKTEEGRDLWLVKMVQLNNTEKGRRVAVWIEGGIHAREWIASSTSFHLVEMIAKSYNSSSYFDYFIVPMANPDGYEYSRTTNRMWRKNRSKNKDESEKMRKLETRDRNDKQEDCVGVDLNRNWDVEFSVGASDNPCNDLYHGPSPFSELETKALSKAMIEANETHILDVVLSMHSYGNVLLFPWGYTSDPIEDTDTLKAAGESFIARAVEVNGTEFGVENSAGGLYFASGATDDWSKTVFNSSLVYTVELRKGKEKQFEVSEDEIKPTADEVYAGLNGMLDYYQTNIGASGAAPALTGWVSTVAVAVFLHAVRFITL